MDRAAYLAQLQALLPPGDAWPRDPEAVLTRLLGSGLAGELARIDQRAWDLVVEADPRVTYDLLTDWERVVGEPDSCAGPAEGLELRRRRVVARLTARGGQSRAFMTALAAGMGYEIEIFEYRPFVAGIGRAGLDAANGEASVRHTWRATVLGPRVTWFRAALSQAGVDPLARIDRATDLECFLHRASPAQSDLIIGYTDPRLLAIGGSEILIAGFNVRI
ncbi:Uncharacterized protein YmfQ in lambdoid prophage, DUF2313 family [Tistlia consotensis]|uniref:Uncharacterized protein YmfQ in lambdoid prophage, DUF2313 family n=1 Tax=Tistlia consotensis USBA 355 TaxID=560819 RepID=A0A1Y6CQR7_9PROT|nr:putative phage tail protein [Tistlia consotensis]SMF77486.1 Uncharacterized protein YmfQ in lambdoid prophage, DUF2313 family [Tistlia consotensis USBA 355]SMF83822.1 Uncharacterized protein YmfQ in lambdoid prophage, DUF2313 family [Tistlia consotensis USBA 355]SNS34580.1 Uncharacterized protein YmfQ in lambdoid prophage, DUF2313 family [Tistlia consotensis]